MTCSMHSPNLTFVHFNTNFKRGVDDPRDKRKRWDLKEEAQGSNVSGNPILKKVMDISEDTPGN